MKTFLSAPAALALAAIVAGCAGGAYKQGNWVHSGQDADWDIDSAVCIQRSETLTADDYEAIEAAKQANRDAADIIGAQSDLMSATGVDSPYADYASGLFGIFSGSENANAEEIHKERKFTACMEGKGWSK